ncbi:hypothetical protein VNI00_012286 [Paramarasmius palmivorus]|uniref:Uncharacterized protein n=1 Tax=Paramarasmius palmivorus TaxID=297713 RepID=A0AAW0CA51_9AGAR
MPSTHQAHIYHVSDDNSNSSTGSASDSESGGLLEDFLSHVFGHNMSPWSIYFNSESTGLRHAAEEADYREATDVGACGKECFGLASKRRADTNTPCSPAQGSRVRPPPSCLTGEPVLSVQGSPLPRLSHPDPAAVPHPTFISSTSLSRHRSRTSSSLVQMDTGRLRIIRKRSRFKRQDDPSSTAASTTPEPTSSTGIDPSSSSPTTFASTPPASSITVSESGSSLSPSFSPSIPILPSISIGISISIGLPSSTIEGSSISAGSPTTTTTTTTTESESTTSTSDSSSSSTLSSSSSSSSSSSYSSSSTTDSSSSPLSSSSSLPPSSSISSTQPPSSSSQSPSSPSSQPPSSQFPSSSFSASSTLSPAPSSSVPSSTSISQSLTSTTTVVPTSTLFTTFTSFTTVSSRNTSQSTSTVTSTGALNTEGASNGSNFAQNKGAIIGVAVGGVAAVIIAVILLFLFCGRWRRRRSFAAGNADPTLPVIPVVGPLRRDASRGGMSGSSSRRMLNRNYSSTETGIWRPPLTDEDDDDPTHMAQLPPLPQSPMGVTGISQGHSSSGEDISASGHGHGSSQSHDQYAYYAAANSVDSSHLGRRPSLAQQNQNQMPGFGQAAEHMAVVDLATASTPMSPTFSIGPPPPPSVPVPVALSKAPSAFAYGSSSSHGHSSSSTDDVAGGRKSGSGTSLMHTNTMKSVTSSSSGSGSHSHSHGTQPSVPRVRIQEASPTNTISGKQIDRLRGRRESTGSFKGLISRLRGGRSSTQDLGTNSGSFKGKETVAVPSPSSFYPPTASTGLRASSLLNPPLPPPVPVEPVELPMQQLGPGWIHPEPPPFPSPAPTEESSLRLPDGLLDPQLVGAALGGPGSDTHGHEITPRPSMSSLRDNIDYSRPYRGFVFNRMGSSTTFNTQDTRSIHAPSRTPAIDTPGSLFGMDDTIQERNEYFGTAL